MEMRGSVPGMMAPAYTTAFTKSRNSGVRATEVGIEGTEGIETSVR